MPGTRGGTGAASSRVCAAALLLALTAGCGAPAEPGVSPPVTGPRPTAAVDLSTARDAVEAGVVRPLGTLAAVDGEHRRHLLALDARGVALFESGPPTDGMTVIGPGVELVDLRTSMGGWVRDAAAAPEPGQRIHAGDVNGEWVAWEESTAVQDGMASRVLAARRSGGDSVELARIGGEGNWDVMGQMGLSRPTVLAGRVYWAGLAPEGLNTDTGAPREWAIFSRDVRGRAPARVEVPGGYMPSRDQCAEARGESALVFARSSTTGPGMETGRLEVSRRVIGGKGGDRVLWSGPVDEAGAGVFVAACGDTVAVTVSAETPSDPSEVLLVEPDRIVRLLGEPMTGVQLTDRFLSFAGKAGGGYRPYLYDRVARQLYRLPRPPTRSEAVVRGRFVGWLTQEPAGATQVHVGEVAGRPGA